MTELINNRLARREAIKEIISKLKNGASIKDVQEEFQTIIKDIGPNELASIENELLQEGMPEAELKKMCDVHLATFDGPSFQRIPYESIPGHPAHTFVQENKAITNVLTNLKSLFQDIITNPSADSKFKFLEEFNLLMDIEKHYQRKEMLLFPLLEKHGFTGPSKVMWAVHDDIRADLKLFNSQIVDLLPESFVIIKSSFEKLSSSIISMIAKEEKILLPTSLEMLTPDEWLVIHNESSSYGYTIYSPDKNWHPRNDIQDENLLLFDFSSEQVKTPVMQDQIANLIKLPTGRLSLDQLVLIFKYLPLDVTFIDADDTVVFYSHGQNKIFTRTNAILGRKVQNCHPPSSVHLVNEIVDDFKSGKEDKAEFWLDFKGSFVYICFYAIRDDKNVYQGSMEVVLDASHYRQLTGEKRLYSSV